MVILLLAMLLESFLRLKHRRRQQLGYLRFYRNTRHLLSVPFYAAAVATAALLLVELWPDAVAWLPQHHKLVCPACPLDLLSDSSPDLRVLTCYPHSLCCWQVIITSLECLTVVIFTFLYVTRVRCTTAPRRSRMPNATCSLRSTQRLIQGSGV